MDTTGVITAIEAGEDVPEEALLDAVQELGGEALEDPNGRGNALCLVALLLSERFKGASVDDKVRLEMCSKLLRSTGSLDAEKLFASLLASLTGILDDKDLLRLVIDRIGLGESLRWLGDIADGASAPQPVAPAPAPSAQPAPTPRRVFGRRTHSSSNSSPATPTAAPTSEPSATGSTGGTSTAESSSGGFDPSATQVPPDSSSGGRPGGRHNRRG